MRALVKDERMVGLREVPRPVASREDDVIIQVAVAGLCRTDVYVAEGRLPVRPPLVLGHELAGTVAEVGRAVCDLRPGERVTVHPLLACGDCPGCQRGGRCGRPAQLGVHHDGAFAEYVRVPASAVYRLPPGLPFTLGAYVEPVAAALGVLEAQPRPGQRGLIYGDNRIAQLTRRVLAAHGLGEVPLYAPRGGERLAADAYDFIIETELSDKALADMLEALRPGGTLVLKSRRHEPVALPVARAVLKDVTLKAVSYGPFSEALALLAEGRLKVDDLLGEVHPLEAHAALFAAAGRSEERKVFFAPGRG
jgi:L-iditol 2-dehydrogenase